MSGFFLGTIRLAAVWEPLLHPLVRRLTTPTIAEINCDDCLMVKAGIYPLRAKCCNYVPDFPNFLAGEILSHGPSSPGHETVADWVEQGRGDPLFVYAPPRLTRKYRQAADRGSRQALGCPLLDDNGRCSVYDHRPYLCVGHHCVYPGPSEVRAFFGCLASLLALHTALVAQYLLIAQGIDPDSFSDAWSQVVDDRSVWSVHDQLDPGFSRALWQGRADHAAYYRGCFEWIMQRRESVRGLIAEYRRNQLLRRADLSEAEKHRIRAQCSEPEAGRVPPEAHEVFMRDVLVFAQHRWTVTDHEGWLLWYHRRLVEQGVVAAATAES
ncbi:MAG: hypothetical protein HYV63_11805 [Candidatus Schekmanbacteria bacterium]|nr:hypothetical protein [Candidatus Schekmanbacteria bacterium]